MSSARRKPFKPTLFLSFAHCLFETPSSLSGKVELRESLVRTVVSRAYYAAFLEAYLRILSKRPGLLPRERRDTAEVHDLVGKAFTETGHPDIGSMLGDLRRRRNVADYAVDEEVTGRQAEEALELSDELVPLIQGV